MFNKLCSILLMLIGSFIITPIFIIGLICLLVFVLGLQLLVLGFQMGEK